MSDEPLASVHPIGARRRRLSMQQWPITLVLIVVAASMLLVATNHFRRGSVLLSAIHLASTHASRAPKFKVRLRPPVK